MVQHSKDYKHEPYGCLCTNNCRRLSKDQTNNINRYTCDENCRERCHQESNQYDVAMSGACCQGCKGTCKDSKSRHGNNNSYSCQRNCREPCDDRHGRPKQSGIVFNTCFQGCAEPCTRRVKDGGDSAHSCNNDCEKPCEHPRQTPAKSETTSGDRGASRKPKNKVCSCKEACTTPNECESEASNRDSRENKSRQPTSDSNFSSDDGTSSPESRGGNNGNSSKGGDDNDESGPSSSTKASEKQGRKCNTKVNGKNSCNYDCERACNNQGKSKATENKSCSCPSSCKVSNKKKNDDGSKNGSCGNDCKKSCKGGGESTDRGAETCSSAEECTKNGKQDKGVEGSCEKRCKNPCKDGGKSKNKKSGQCSCPGNCKEANKNGNNSKDGDEADSRCGKDCTKPCKESGNSKDKDKRETCSCPEDCKGGGKKDKKGNESKQGGGRKPCEVCASRKKDFSYEDYLAGASNGNEDSNETAPFEGIPPLFPTLNEVFGPSIDDTILNMMSALKGEESEERESENDEDSADNTTDNATGVNGEDTDKEQENKNKKPSDKSENKDKKTDNTSDSNHKGRTPKNKKKNPEKTCDAYSCPNISKESNDANDSSDKKEKQKGKKKSGQDKKSSSGGSEDSKDNDKPKKKDSKATKKEKGSKKNDSGDSKQNGDEKGDASPCDDGSSRQQAGDEESENTFALRDLFGPSGDEALLAAISKLWSLFSTDVDNEAGDKDEKNNGSNKSDKPDDKNTKKKGKKKNGKDGKDDDGNGKKKNKKSNCFCNRNNAQEDKTAKDKEKDAESKKKNNKNVDKRKKKPEENTCTCDDDSEDEETAGKADSDVRPTEEQHSDVKDDSIAESEPGEMPIDDFEQSVDEPADTYSDNVCLPNEDPPQLEQDDLGFYNPGAGEQPIHVVRWLHHEYLSLAYDMETLSADLDADEMLTRQQNIKERQDALDSFSDFLAARQQFDEAVRICRRSSSTFVDYNECYQWFDAVPGIEELLLGGNALLGRSWNESQLVEDELWHTLQYQESIGYRNPYLDAASPWVDHGDRSTGIESDRSRPTTHDANCTWTRGTDASNSHRSHREENTHRSAYNILFGSHIEEETLRSPKRPHMNPDSFVNVDFRLPSQTSGEAPGSRQMVTHMNSGGLAGNEIRLSDITRGDAPGFKQVRPYGDSGRFAGDDLLPSGQNSGEVPGSRQMETHMNSGGLAGNEVRLPGITRADAPGSKQGRPHRDSASFAGDDLLPSDQNSGKGPYSNQRSSQRKLSGYTEDRFGILSESGGSVRRSRPTSEEDGTDDLLFLYQRGEWNTHNDLRHNTRRGSSGRLVQERTSQGRTFSRKVGLKAKSSTISRKGKARLLKLNKKGSRRRHESLRVIAEKSANDALSSDYGATSTSSYYDIETSPPMQQNISPKADSLLIAVFPNTPSSYDTSIGDNSSTCFKNIDREPRVGYEKKTPTPAYELENIYEQSYKTQSKGATMLDKNIDPRGLKGAVNFVNKKTFYNGGEKCYNISRIEQNGTQREMSAIKKCKRPPMHVWYRDSETDYPDYVFGILNLDKSTTNVETLWKRGITSQDFKSSTMFNDPDFSSQPHETVSVNAESDSLDDTSPQLERSSSSSSFTRFSFTSVPYDEKELYSQHKSPYKHITKKESSNVQEKGYDDSLSSSDTQDQIEILFPPPKRNHHERLETIDERDVEQTPNSSSNRLSSTTSKSSAPFFRSIETQTSAAVVTTSEKDEKPKSNMFSTVKNSLLNMLKDPHNMSISTQCPSLKLFARGRKSKTASSKVTLTGSQTRMVSKCVDTSDLEGDTESPKKEQDKQTSQNKKANKQPHSSSSTGKYNNEGRKGCLCSSLKSSENKFPKSSETKKRKKSIHFSFLESHPRWKRCLSHISLSASAQGERFLRSIKPKLKQPRLELTAAEAGTNSKQNSSKDECCKHYCPTKRNENVDTGKGKGEGKDGQGDRYKDEREDEDRDEDSSITQRNSTNVELKGSDHQLPNKEKLPTTSTVQINVDGSGKATVEWGPHVAGKAGNDAGKSRKPKKPKKSKDSKDEPTNESVRWAVVHIQEYKDGSKVFTFSNSVTRKPLLAKSDIYVVFVVPPSGKETALESSGNNMDSEASAQKTARKSSTKKTDSKPSGKKTPPKSSPKKKDSGSSAKKAASKSSAK